MDNLQKSILIVSEDAEFTRHMSEVLGQDPGAKIASEVASFNGLNGKASRLAFKSDIVIFDANPADQDESKAISELLKNKTHETVFVALTDNEVSLIEARRLQGLGIDEVLPRSISAEDLNALIQNALDVRARAGQARSGETSEGTLISVGQARGGVGATSLAVNLARALAHEKRTFSKDRKNRVVLIDLDLQFGDAHVHLDIEDNGAFQGLLEAGDDPDPAYILGMLQKHSSGLEILNAPASIAPLQSLSGALVSTMLTHLKSEFDYVIADLPRAMVDWVEPVLFQSSRLLLVTDTSVPSIRQTRRISDFYKEANIGLQVELVVNFESKPLFKSRHHKDAEAALEATFSHWIPANTKVARRAGDLGRAAVEIAPGSDIGKAYSGIAQQIQNDFPHKSIHAKGA